MAPDPIDKNICHASGPKVIPNTIDLITDFAGQHVIYPLNYQGKALTGGQNRVGAVGIEDPNVFIIVNNARFDNIATRMTKLKERLAMNGLGIITCDE